MQLFSAPMLLLLLGRLPAKHNWLPIGQLSSGTQPLGLLRKLLLLFVLELQEGNEASTGSFFGPFGNERGNE